MNVINKFYPLNLRAIFTRMVIGFAAISSFTTAALAARDRDAIEVSNSSFQLRGGLYDTDDSGICAFQVINDLPRDRIILRGVSTPGKPCEEPVGVFEASRTSKAEYSDVVYSKTLDEETIQRCTPTANNSKPCAAALYSEKGQLLAQVGDLCTSTLVVSLLNPKAFRTHFYRKIWRDGRVIIEESVKSEDLLFYQAD